MMRQATKSQNTCGTNDVSFEAILGSSASWREFNTANTVWSFAVFLLCHDTYFAELTLERHWRIIHPPMIDCSLGHARKVFEKVWFHRRFRTAMESQFWQNWSFYVLKMSFLAFWVPHLWIVPHSLSLSFSLASCIVPPHRIIDFQLHRDDKSIVPLHMILDFQSCA